MEKGDFVIVSDKTHDKFLEVGIISNTDKLESYNACEVCFKDGTTYYVDYQHLRLVSKG